MEKARRITLLVALLIGAGMCLYPPLLYRSPEGARLTMGYSWLLSLPYRAGEVDVLRLTTELTLLAMGVVGVLLLLRGLGSRWQR